MEGSSAVTLRRPAISATQACVNALIPAKEDQSVDFAPVLEAIIALFVHGLIALLWQHFGSRGVLFIFNFFYNYIANQGNAAPPPPNPGNPAPPPPNQANAAPPPPNHANAAPTPPPSPGHQGNLPQPPPPADNGILPPPPGFQGFIFPPPPPPGYHGYILPPPPPQGYQGFYPQQHQSAIDMSNIYFY